MDNSTDDSLDTYTINILTDAHSLQGWDATFPSCNDPFPATVDGRITGVSLDIAHNDEYRDSLGQGWLDHAPSARDAPVPHSIADTSPQYAHKGPDVGASPSGLEFQQGPQGPIPCPPGSFFPAENLLDVAEPSWGGKFEPRALPLSSESSMVKKLPPDSQSTGDSHLKPLVVDLDKKQGSRTVLVADSLYSPLQQAMKEGDTELKEPKKKKLKAKVKKDLSSFCKKSGWGYGLDYFHEQSGQNYSVPHPDVRRDQGGYNTTGTIHSPYVLAGLACIFEHLSPDAVVVFARTLNRDDETNLWIPHQFLIWMSSAFAAACLIENGDMSDLIMSLFGVPYDFADNSKQSSYRFLAVIDCQRLLRAPFTDNILNSVVKDDVELSAWIDAACGRVQGLISANYREARSLSSLDLRELEFQWAPVIDAYSEVGSKWHKVSLRFFSKAKEKGMQVFKPS